MARRTPPPADDGLDRADTIEVAYALTYDIDAGSWSGIAYERFTGHVLVRAEHAPSEDGAIAQLHDHLLAAGYNHTNTNIAHDREVEWRSSQGGKARHEAIRRHLDRQLLEYLALTLQCQARRGYPVDQPEYLHGAAKTWHAVREEDSDLAETAYEALCILTHRGLQRRMRDIAASWTPHDDKWIELLQLLKDDAPGQ